MCRAPRAGSWVAGLLGLVGCSPLDTDGDGVTDRLDCAPTDGDRAPGRGEVWDDSDNDCDGSVDEGPWRTVEEPPEFAPPRGVVVGAENVPVGAIGWDACWYGGAVSAGAVGPMAHVATDLVGSIGWLAAGELWAYDRSDSDCWALWLPFEGWLDLELAWWPQSTDLDVVISAPWRGTEGSRWPPTREIFGLATGTNEQEPTPVAVHSSATFPAGVPVFVWVAGYSGAPATYRLRVAGVAR